MRHMIAWGATAAGSDGEYANISAIQDGVIFSAGDDIRVPADLSNLAGLASVNNNDQSGPTRITSPRLRRRANVYAPLVTADGTIGDQYPYLQWIKSPIVLTPEESLRYQRSVPTVAGTTSIGVAELSDGAMQPIMGDFISLRVTATVTGGALDWHNGQITFDEILPTGWYMVVGMTWTGVNGIAARLQLPGFPYRPGCLMRSGANITPYFGTMYGEAGEYGRFHTNQPPSMDFLGHGDLTTQVGWFDLIQM